jgi:hypothetical protein
MISMVLDDGSLHLSSLMFSYLLGPPLLAMLAPLAAGPPPHRSVHECQGDEIPAHALVDWSRAYLSHKRPPFTYRRS